MNHCERGPTISNRAKAAKWDKKTAILGKISSIGPVDCAKKLGKGGQERKGDTSDDLGETVDAALAPTSPIRSILAERRAKDATITLWTYPECFDEFRREKKELYRLGFSVGSRPLPKGVPISGSSQGSKSTAE